MAVARHNSRVSVGTIPDVLELPDLIEIQTKSFKDFLQWETPPDERKPCGLQEVFNEVFPIASPNGLTRLEFVQYSLSPPKYSIQECLDRAMTYSGTLKALLRLVRYEEIGASGEQREKMMLEQEVFLGELPIMTPTGTFVINGAERVVVSQLHKSPGVSFEHKQHQNGKTLLCARIIPYRGAWLEFEYDLTDYLWVIIDRRSKLLATTFLKCFGIVEPEEILKLFYDIETVTFKRTRVMIGKRSCGAEELAGRILASDVIDEETGEVLADAAEELNPVLVDRIMASSVHEIHVIVVQDLIRDPSILLTLQQDKTVTDEDALREYYSRSRPGDPATPATCRSFFNKTFTDPARYDFAAVGRYKINRKLGLQIDQNNKTLTLEDVLKAMQYLSGLRGGEGVFDDIDHLGNRRIRSVGEMAENQFRVGLVRVERAVKERLSLGDLDTLMPQDL
ncbi:MAG TPA: DNA-directed RNA polymerase subunit beta, partial [Candidatus Hydrogenedentes bacterium]|nr:DNA-directed RNA polymerase subunit beta [Candidatus Hydrogenedentota bacterium]